MLKPKWAIAMQLGRHKIGSREPKHRRHVVLVLAVCFLAWQAFSAGTAPTLPDPGNPRMGRDQQEKLGLQVAAQVYQQMPVLPDSSPETKYIQALGQRLAATIPPKRSWPFQFHVIEQKEINAFALPGGPMFVNVGTIVAADNEAELAGVMAHEMGHVYMQHSAKQQDKATLLGGLAGIAGAIAGNIGGNWGTLAQSGIQIGAGTLMLKYSRGDEAQADSVGAIILWKAGFNPMALADFFRKIEAQGGNGPQFLSDHPNPGNREQAIKMEIREWPPRHYSGNSPQFAVVRQDAAKVPAYTAQEIAAGAKDGRWAAQNAKNGAILPGAAGVPASGTTANSVIPTVPRAPLTSVQPSLNFRSATIGEVTIQRPDNWDVTQSQDSRSATIAPSAGVSGGAVAYGVVIQSVSLTDSNMSAEQLTSAAAKNLQANDPNMKQSGEIETIRVDGQPAGSARLATVSPMPGPDGKSQPERDWLVAVPRGGARAILLVFVAPESHFDVMKPTFEKMLHSIRF
ncbi:MAG TPA: M48 family metallopeptidase [Candidatus Acidoferrales bacterium]